ncbi:phage terminase large subunit [Sphingomonas sp. MMS24-JH45]
MGVQDQQMVSARRLSQPNLDYPDLKQEAMRLWRQWKPDRVLIEDAGAGKSLAQDLRISGPFRPMLVRATVDKETRFTGCFGEIEGGHILLPTEAPWLDVLCKELRAFPLGKHDDQVDSVSQFINHQKNHRSWILTSCNDSKGRADHCPTRATSVHGDRHRNRAMDAPSGLTDTAYAREHRLACTSRPVSVDQTGSCEGNGKCYSGLKVRARV